jgi:hypothetical protein
MYCLTISVARDITDRIIQGTAPMELPEVNLCAILRLEWVRQLTVPLEYD